MIEYIVKIFDNQYASGILLALVGTLLGVVVTKITSKMSLVAYSVSTLKLGETATNAIHGKIEVRCTCYQETGKFELVEGNTFSEI